MTPFQASVTHSVNSAIIIAASVGLMVTNKIDSATGTALIAAAGGLSLGVGAVSIGAGQSGPTTPASTAPQRSGTVPTQ